jgi:glycosyltransferase involved in cell wall biosynthesis
VRIACLPIWHGEEMGYADNFLPAALARLGADVHIVAPNVRPHFGARDYDAVYAPHFGPGEVPCGTHRRDDGVTVHRLPHRWYGKYIGSAGLYAKLRELRPDVVQTFEVRSWPTRACATYKPWLGYRMFTECHVHASVFPPLRQWPPLRTRLWWKGRALTVGKLVSTMTSRCYAISPDAARIATHFFGMDPRKTTVVPLGTDTQLFRPAATADEMARWRETRARWGFDDTHVVCIHTGRLTRPKGPILMAHAICRLVAEGLPFRGVFIGHGPADVTRVLAATPGCVLEPFVTMRALPPLYQAADIGVWPKQESTSQIDAVAAGLPLVLNDTVEVTERVAGNGLLFRDDDSDDLADKLRSLLDPARRRAMAALGRERIVRCYDWSVIARQRLRDYEHALGAAGAPDKLGASACRQPGQQAGAV